MSPLAGDETEVVEEIRFLSGAFALEGQLRYLESGAVQGAVVLAGPHPMLGGDMNNNVVRGLSIGLARRGIAVLSFNYRGVGGSEGPSPDVTGSLAEFWATSRTSEEEHYADDFSAAVRNLSTVVGADFPLALVGYSFGCSILTAAAVGGEYPLVMVAPTIGQHDYSALTEIENPVLVVASDRDFAADADAVTQWFASLRGPKRMVRGEWDDHFFRGQEDRLAETVFAFLCEHWEVHP